MIQTEEEILTKTQADIRNNPLSEEGGLKVQSVLDLDIEIESIESILNAKKERLQEKKEDLDTEEKFIYNSKWLEANIIKNNALRRQTDYTYEELKAVHDNPHQPTAEEIKNTFIEDDREIDLSKLKI